MTVRRAPIFGPEPWATLGGQTWSHYDRWFALVCDAAFAGDLTSLRDEFVTSLKEGPSFRRDDVHARLSHLADLADRLSAAVMTVGDLVGHEVVDKATMTKARGKVMEQSLEWRAKTPAMRRPPSVVLQERARTGRWGAFPADPAPWYDHFAPLVDGDHLAMSPAMWRATEVEELLAALDDGLVADERLALHRGFHTAGLVLADRADDSCGVIGEVREQAFTTYVSLDRSGMDVEAYWRDLCELVVWEPYGLWFKRETLPFRRVGLGEAELVEAILLELAAEHRAVWLDYQADEAECAVAWLHVAGRRYTSYESAAARLGSAHWMPVVAMAESAVRGGRDDIAHAVYDAADQPGWHRDLIRRKRAELAAGDGKPALRLVE